MSTDNAIAEDMRQEYQRTELGVGVRGKYATRYAKGVNLVLLDERVAKAFPTSEAVNEALLGLMALARRTAQPHIKGHSKKSD